MEKKQKKFKQTLTDQQTADFLRELASGIENGVLDLDQESYVWPEIQKIKISFKNQESQVVVKTRLKSSPPDIEMDLDYNDSPEDSDSSRDEESRPSYKKLKKRMKKYLKTIHSSLSQNQMPAEQEMIPFLKDCELMTAYPGYGDEFYAEFMEKVKEMDNAFKGQDLTGVSNSFDDLVNLMKDCHSRYK